MNEDLEKRLGMARRESVEVTIEGTFLVSGPRAGKGSALLVGFHGYAETAETQMRRMLTIPGVENYWLCSIQALHPFYIRKTGDVVASWMTKFRREPAIRENMNYLDNVLSRLREEIPAEVPLALLGFSQGVAMAFRAAGGSLHLPRALVVLGGDLPPDVSERKGLILPPVLLGRGEDDPYYSREQFGKDMEALQRLGAKVTPFAFEGGHEWSERFSREVGSFLERIQPPTSREN